MVSSLKALVRRGRDAARLALLPVLRPRRIDVCCCGLSKSGTHSIAGIFENYRSAHHPDADLRLALVMDFLHGEVDDEHVRALLKKRDRWMWLEMESSNLAGIFIEPMLAACPGKKFILTLRDVYSWCDSWFDHHVNLPPDPSSPWARLDQVRLRVREHAPTRYDAPLVERGLAPLACYFRLWHSHNARVLEAVPRTRLLIVRTEHIIATIPVMAEWLGVRVETLRPDRGWLFAAPERHGILGKLDPGYVRETQAALCGTLMQQYFPDTTLDSVVEQRRVRVLPAS